MRKLISIALAFFFAWVIWCVMLFSVIVPVIVQPVSAGIFTYNITATPSSTSTPTATATPTP